MATEPLVSVRLATYKHEAWIAQCLEGILMQRTDFPFEVIVGEDDGPDQTRKIAQSYADRFPDRVRLLPAEPNLGPMRNSYRIQQACRGKYHAMIEGDDYWIDPLKLQSQADFLEAHPDVSVCVHNAFILNEMHGATRLFYETPPAPIGDFEAGLRMTFPTASVMARGAVLASLPAWRLKIWCGDLLFRLWCLHHGKFAYVNRIMSVYRRHQDGLDARRWQLGVQAHFNDVLFTLRQFDRDTQLAHTASLRREIARKRQEQLRRRFGLMGLLFSPGHLTKLLREYAFALRQKRRLFNG